MVLCVEHLHELKHKGRAPGLILLQQHEGPMSPEQPHGAGAPSRWVTVRHVAAAGSLPTAQWCPSSQHEDPQ